MVEDVPDAEATVGRHPVDPTDQGGRLQRGATQQEEVVGGSDLLAGEAEHVGDDADQCGLGITARCATDGRHAARRRLRQCPMVELAVAGQRDLVQHDDRGRDHVARQAAADRLQHLCAVQCFRGVCSAGRPARPRHVTDQGGRCALAADDGGGEVDSVHGRQCRTHLVEFDAETADLHLVVTATVVGQRAVGVAVHDVTGAVHDGAVSVGGGHEPAGGQTAAPQVAPCHSRPAEVELAGDVVGQSPQPVVEDECGALVDRRADGDRLTRVQRRRHRRDDGRLGRPVGVDVATAGSPARHQFRGAGLATHTEGPQVRERMGCRGGERRRRDERVGHLALVEELDEFVATVDRRRCHHHRRAGLDGEEELQHRCVERGGGEQQGAIAGADLVPLPLGLGERGQAAMGHAHALRFSGGAGGVDDVGDRVRVPGRGSEACALAGTQILRGQPPDVVRHIATVVGAADAQDGARIGDHVGDPLGRVTHVDRQRGRARLRHGPRGDHRLQAAIDGDRDHVLGADPEFAQRECPARGDPIDLGVGERAVSVLDRHAIGVVDDGVGEDVGKMPRLDRAVVAHSRIDGVHQLGRPGEVVERCRRIRGDRACEIDEHPGQFADALARVDIGRISEPRAPIADSQFEVEPGGRGLDLLGDDLQAGQINPGVVRFEGVRDPGVERQRDLEYRMPVRARRIEHRDDLLERHVGARQRVQIAAADGVEQGREPLAPVDRGPEDDRVHEHTDDVGEPGIGASGDGGADHDVRRRTGDMNLRVGVEPVQQRGEHRMHAHEFGRPAAAQCGEAAAQFGVEVDLDHARGAGGPARRVGHEDRTDIDPFQVLSPPVGQIGPGLEVIGLPAQVVAIVQGRRSGGDRGFGTVLGRRPQFGVGGGDVAVQRHHGPTVGSDVVDDKGQLVMRGVTVDPVQCDAQRYVDGQVERATRQRLRLGRPLRRSRLDDGEFGLHLVGGTYVQVGAPVVLGVDGAQHLVSVDGVSERAGEGVHVEIATEIQREGDGVIGCRRTVVVVGSTRIGVGTARELVEEPELLLRGSRLRGAVRIVPEVGERPRLDEGGVTLVGAAEPGDAGDGRVVEDLADGDSSPGETLECADDLGRQQRVAAEIEEVMIAADGARLQLETLGDQIGDCLLQGVARRDERHVAVHRSRLRRGQCPEVDLADRGRGDLVELDDRRRDHVPRQALCQSVSHRSGLPVGARGHGHVGHEMGAVALAVRGGDRRPHRLVGDQGGVDLTEFDAMPADLGLMVGPPAELEFVIGGPPDEVAGSVHALAGIAIGVGDEAFGCQRSDAVVPAGEMLTGDVQLADRAGGDRTQALVQDQRGDAADGPADGQRRVVGTDRRRHRGHHGGLGGTVRVEQLRAGRPGADHLGVRVLAADDECLEIGDVVRGHGRQHRRGQERVRDPRIAHQLGEFGAADDPRRHDVHGRPGGDRHQDLEYRRIETRRRHVHRPTGGRDPVLRDLLRAEVGESAVADDDALGRAGGPRCVDQVGGLVDVEDASSLRVRDGLR